MKKGICYLAFFLATAGSVCLGDCPIVFRASACTLGNGEIPPYYSACSGTMTGGPYFDRAALTFEPDEGEINKSSNTCGKDCHQTESCFQSTITVSGIDCTGTRLTLTHNDCCMENPD
jgi:hypothetical protein